VIIALDPPVYMLRTILTGTALILLSVPAAQAVPVELRGSLGSMERQHQVAVQSELSFARTFEDIERMLDTGELVRLTGNEHYMLREGLRTDAARPEVRLFVERLAEEYFEATGEKLVVTSLTRPSGNQPRNAHRLSVHPTGMAFDLRISQKAASRQWIEKHLLGKEAKGLLDITRERFPPHYHVALFPDQYLASLKEAMGAEAMAEALHPRSDIEPHEEWIVLPGEEPEDEPLRRTIWSFFVGLFVRAV